MGEFFGDALILLIISLAVPFVLRLFVAVQDFGEKIKLPIWPLISIAFGIFVMWVSFSTKDSYDVYDGARILGMFMLPIVIWAVLKIKSCRRKKFFDSGNKQPLNIKAIRLHALKKLSLWLWLIIPLVILALFFIILFVVGCLCLCGAIKADKSGDEIVIISAAGVLFGLCLWGLIGIYRKNKPIVAILKKKFCIIKLACTQKLESGVNVTSTDMELEGVYNLCFGGLMVKASKELFYATSIGDEFYIIFSKHNSEKVANIYPLKKYDIDSELYEYLDNKEKFPELTESINVDSDVAELNEEYQEYLEKVEKRKEIFYKKIEPFIKENIVREVYSGRNTCILNYGEVAYLACPYELIGDEVVGIRCKETHVEYFVKDDTFIYGYVKNAYEQFEKYKTLIIPLELPYIDILKENIRINKEKNHIYVDYELEKRLKKLR